MHNKLLYGVFIMIQPCAESNAQQIIPNFVIAVLNRYQDLFKEPNIFPTTRSHDQKIPLISNAKVVNPRCYMILHHQKVILEQIIEQLIRDNLIRPSTSPYSSPTILVKKKDLTWRLYVDCKNLNA
jgi:hypothetical protein